MLGPEAFARLAARIREEEANLAYVAAELRQALSRLDASPKDVVTVHGVGGLLHDFYTGVEKVFSLVAPDLNGQTPTGQAWHRELLHAMALDLEGIRPAVVRATTEDALVEFMKFRHVYRNMYGFRLRWSRVRELAELAVNLWPDVQTDLEHFVSFVEAVADPSS